MSRPPSGTERQSIYQTALQASLNPSFNPAERLHKIAKPLAQAWKALQADLKREARNGAAQHWCYRHPGTNVLQVGVGTDRLSDEGLALAGLSERKWSIETRDHLRELEWTGLQRGVLRPRSADEVAIMSLTAEGAARRRDDIEPSSRSRRLSMFGGRGR
jgi:hypothetical protein